MSRKAQKPVRIVKRDERDLIQTRQAALQTSAQVRREMVSTILSWIDDRKRSQRTRRLFGLCLGKLIACEDYRDVIGTAAGKGQIN